MSKLYYSSSEVSTMLDLEPSVLRFWEDQFGQLRIKRNRAGKRLYRKKDIELIRTIKRLTRDEGYTIAGARKKLQESSADRGAAKVGRGGETADRDAAKVGRGGETADRDAAKVGRGGEQAAGGTAKEAPGETTTDPEVIQWIRSRLIELRESMD